MRLLSVGFGSIALFQCATTNIAVGGIPDVRRERSGQRLRAHKRHPAAIGRFSKADIISASAFDRHGVVNRPCMRSGIAASYFPAGFFGTSPAKRIAWLVRL